MRYGPQVLAEGNRRARKHHQCFDCYRSIAPGEVYAFQSLAYDGSAYTIRQHIDCRNLAAEYHADGDGYYGEGYPPLKDAWCESGEYDALCDVYRGFFPHAVCRMEWF